MDMWDPFFTSTLAHVPGAKDKIVFDRYHVIGPAEKPKPRRAKAG